VDLDRMLERCRRDQWSVSDLDWSHPARPMSPEDESAIVQLFTDQALPGEPQPGAFSPCFVDAIRHLADEALAVKLAS
jgi:hypothetical protein